MNTRARPNRRASKHPSRHRARCGVLAACVGSVIARDALADVVERQDLFGHEVRIEQVAGGGAITIVGAGAAPITLSRAGHASVQRVPVGTGVALVVYLYQVAALQHRIRQPLVLSTTPALRTFVMSAPDVMIPTEAGHEFRFEAGHCSGMKPASIPD